jgi:hypothetical protein
MEDILRRMKQVVDFAEREQKNLDDYDAERKLLVDNSNDADNEAFRIIKEEMMKSEVLSEHVWSLEIRESGDGDKIINLINVVEDSTFAKLVEAYKKILVIHGFSYLQHVALNDPKIYLKFNSINFSGLVSWEDQVAFLKKNNIRFDTALGWEQPKGVKRKLRELDKLYD